jgi:hypothetical protein
MSNKTKNEIMPIVSINICTPSNKFEPVEKFELRRLKLGNKTRKNFRLPNSVKSDFRALNFYF